jgi:hypothetical protein
MHSKNIPDKASKSALQPNMDWNRSACGAQQCAGLFDNLPKLMRTEQFAEHFRFSKATIYDWRYRGTLRGVPDNLFLTLNRRLYIRTDVFLAWLASQNPNLDGVDSEAL